MKIELWSDEKLSEFAIKLGSNFVVRTSENASMIKIIDQSNCEYGFDFDWPYTLSQWVTYYLSNKFVALLKDNGNITTLHELTGRSVSILGQPKFRNKRSPKPGLKCHYCNLKYCLEEERKEHEEFWHANELLKT